MRLEIKFNQLFAQSQITAIGGYFLKFPDLPKKNRKALKTPDMGAKT